MNKSLSNVAVYFFSIGFGQLVSFLLIPMIAKNISPSVYGEYAVALSIFNLIGVTGSAWIRNVAFRVYYDKNDDKSISFYYTVSIMQFLVIILSMLIVLPIIQLTDMKFTKTLILFSAGASVLIDDFFSLTSNLLRAENLTIKYAVSSMIHSSIRFISVASAFWIGYNTSSLLFICTAIAGATAGIYSLICYIKTKNKQKKIKLNYAKEVFTLGIQSIPISVGGWVISLSDRLFLKHYTDLATVGIYSIGYALGERLIGGLIGAVFLMAWPTILSEWAKHGEEGARDAIHESLKIFYWITVGPLVFIIYYSKEIVINLTNQNYVSTYTIVIIVTISIWISGLKKYISRPAELNKDYKKMSYITIASALFNIIFNIILIPKYGAFGAAIATLISSVVSIILFISAIDMKMIVMPWKHIFSCFILSIIAVALPNILIKSSTACSIIYILIYTSGFCYSYYNTLRFSMTKI